MWCWGRTILLDYFLLVAPIVVDSNSVIGMNGTSVDIHGVRLNVTYKHNIDTTTTLAFVTQRTESNTTGAHNVLEVKIQSVGETYSLFVKAMKISFEIFQL